MKYKEITIKEIGYGDKRVKIPKEKHGDIIEIHNNGVSIRQLARNYGVDKRLIGFIIYPERLERVKEMRKLRGYKTSTEKQTQYQRVHRRHKRDLLGGRPINIKI